MHTGIETTKTAQIHKASISILLGLLGFVTSYYSLNFRVGNFNVSFVWGYLFPLIAAFAFGSRYGLIAGFFGLAAFTPFLIWPDNGWANVINTLLFLLWLGWHGYAATNLQKKGKWYWQPLLVQLQFGLFYAYVVFTTYGFLFSLNPPLWAAHAQSIIPQDIIISIIIKESVHFLIMVVLAQFFLMTNSVQRLLQLTELPEHKNNGFILLASFVTAGIILLISRLIKDIVVEQGAFSRIFTALSTVEITYAMLILYSSIVGGYIVAKYSSKLLLAMNSLDKAEKFNRLLFNSSPAGLSLCSIDGAFVDFNPAFSKILGRSSEEIMELTYWDITPSIYISQETAQLNSLAETGSYGPYEKEFRHKDGSLVPVILKGLIVNYDSEHYILSTIEDISERKQAKVEQFETSERLTALIEAIPDAIFFKDGEGRWLITNEPAKILFQLQECSWIGKTDSQLADERPEFKALHQKCYQDDEKAWAAGKLIIVDEPVTDKFGNLREFEVCKVPLFHANGERKALVIIGSDVTERKQSEKMLKSALVKAESSDLLKTAFLNNISHEIRTPLNSILGFGQMLTDPGLTLSEKEHFLHILNISSNRLMNTITGYMDISLLVSGNQGVHKKPFAPVDLLDELYKNVAADCKSKSLTLKPVLLPAGNKFRINSDFGLLQKAMQHLLANAIKFTLQGEISFGMEVKEDILLFWVKDTGVGITTEAQGLIFDKFMQENVSSTRGYEGSGLGLSIVKGIVELLEGNIWLESQKGKGASFYFTIPFDVSGVETTDLHDLKIIPGDHPLILIAEDEASNSLFLERLLRKQGFDVIIVRDGRMAVDVCRQNASVSLVLMDLKMPVLDGIQATKEIKSFRSALPVIAVTAYAMSSDETNALEAGCDDYIAKPYNQDALLSKIKKLGCYPLPSVLAPSVS